MKDARVLALEILYDLMRVDPGIDMTKETFLVIARDPNLGRTSAKLAILWSDILRRIERGEHEPSPIT